MNSINVNDCKDIMHFYGIGVNGSKKNRLHLTDVLSRIFKSNMTTGTKARIKTSLTESWIDIGLSRTLNELFLACHQKNSAIHGRIARLFLDLQAIKLLIENAID